MTDTSTPGDPSAAQPGSVNRGASEFAAFLAAPDLGSVGPAAGPARTLSFQLTDAVTATATACLREGLPSWTLDHGIPDWDTSAPLDLVLANIWFLDHAALDVAEASTARSRRLDAVTVPAPVRAAAVAGRHLLVLNPKWRQVAELAEPFGGHYVGESTTATLRISSLDACRLDPILRRFLTPATADLTRFTEQRTIRLANDRRRAAARAAKKQARHDTLSSARDAEHRTWVVSPYHARAVETFGSVPWWLTSSPGPAAAWAADPALWRAVIWFDLINAPDPDGTRLWRTVDDATRILARRNIAARPGFGGQDEALLAFIDSLGNARLVERHLSSQGQLLGFRLPAPYVTPAPDDVTQSPAERMMAAMHLRPYEAVVHDQTLWLQRFPSARTLPTLIDGKIRFVPRPDTERTSGQVRLSSRSLPLPEAS